ncbi:unnamed protein product [Rotaria sp. Silwood1]|nr:unnamed protein product [Rotaria sp. Silwood1]
MCLGNLQHLKNRFGDGYAVQVKVSIDKVQKIKDDLTSFFPEIEIQDQHDGMLFCNIPFSSTSSSPLKDKNATTSTFNLVRIFAMLNAQKNQKLIESYSLSQTTLEQIFVRLAGDDEDNISTISSNKEPLNQTEAADENRLISPRKQEELAKLLNAKTAVFDQGHLGDDDVKKELFQAFIEHLANVN